MVRLNKAFPPTPVFPLPVVEKFPASGPAKKLPVPYALAERARHRAVFDNVRVDGARYYVDRRFLPIAIVEFQITNNTNRAFAKGYFHGVLRSPGRSLPWMIGATSVE